jgi:hypothetical protein
MKNILGLIFCVPFYILLYIIAFTCKSDSQLARESYEVRI